MNVYLCSNHYSQWPFSIFTFNFIFEIEDIHKVQQLKFFYKLTHKDLPEYFNGISLIQVGDIHDHVTRNRKKNYTQRIYHQFAEKSIIQYFSHNK